MILERIQRQNALTGNSGKLVWPIGMINQSDSIMASTTAAALPSIERSELLRVASRALGTEVEHVGLVSGELLGGAFNSAATGGLWRCRGIADGAPWSAILKLVQ